MVLLALLLAVAPAGPAAVLWGPDEAWRIELHARALAPGEPVRVVATAEVSLEFLGRSVALAPDPASSRWVGWAAVPLDAAAGPGEVEVTWTSDGRARRHTTRVTLEARKFPEQRLRVESRYVEPPAEVTRRIDEERARLEGLWAGRARPSAPPRPFVRPVPGGPTGTFGARRVFNGQPRAPHAGLDLKAAVGTPVVAAGAGRVALAEDLYWTGGTVIVDHGDGLFTVYAHLSSIGVEEGAPVEAGAAIGRSGATGRVTGPHLHWGAKVGGVNVDPRAFLDPRLFP